MNVQSKEEQYLTKASEKCSNININKHFPLEICIWKKKRKSDIYFIILWPIFCQPKYVLCVHCNVYVMEVEQLNDSLNNSLHCTFPW